MNIAKALKVKNRLIGKIATQQQIVCRENSRRSDSVSTVNVETEFNTLLDLVNQLTELKAKISVASSPLFEKVIKLQETKNLVNFLKGLHTREGIEKLAYGQNHIENYTWTAFINTTKQETLIAKYEEVINTLQDEIDNFNAVTSV